MAHDWFSIDERDVYFRPSNGSSPRLSGTETAAAVTATGKWKLEIFKRNQPHRFVVFPKRWIVERTFACISLHRRLVRDFERYARSGAPFIRLAMIRITLRRLTKPAR